MSGSLDGNCFAWEMKELLQSSSSKILNVEPKRGYMFHTHGISCIAVDSDYNLLVVGTLVSSFNKRTRKYSTMIYLIRQLEGKSI
mgnify:CR=1 FL=1